MTPTSPNEQSWLDLGQQLRDYQPPGDPTADYAAFTAGRRAAGRTRLLRWVVAGVILLLAGGLAHVLLRPAADLATVPALSNPAAQTAPVAAEGMILTAPAATPPDAAPVSVAPSTASESDPGPASAPVTSTPATQTNLNPSLPAAPPATALVPDPAPAPAPASPAPARPDLAPAPAKIIPSAPEPLEFAPQSALPSLDVSQAIPLLNVPRSTPPVAAPAAAAPKPRYNFFFGAGTVTHWRGDRFMADPALGLYAHVGLRQSIGRRLGLEATVGYRDNGLATRTTGSNPDMWAYNKKQEQIIDGNGDAHNFVYEGYVTGYRALEFSLTVDYRLTPRLGVHAGGRYALPTFDFRERLEGPEEFQPFSRSADPGSLVSNFDYGFLLGTDFFLTRDLSLRTTLHFGRVDLIDDEAEDAVRHNHSSSLNVGLRCLLR